MWCRVVRTLPSRWRLGTVSSAEAPPAETTPDTNADLSIARPMRGRRPHALLPNMGWLTVRATGGNFYAVREPELGVATTDVQQVVLEVVQQVNHGASDWHVE